MSVSRIAEEPNEGDAIVLIGGQITYTVRWSSALPRVVFAVRVEAQRDGPSIQSHESVSEGAWRDLVAQAGSWRESLAVRTETAPEDASPRAPSHGVSSRDAHSGAP